MLAQIAGGARPHWWRHAIVLIVPILVLVILVTAEALEQQPEYQPTRDMTLEWQAGWVVTWIHPASDSYDSGLRPGDHIIAVGDHQLTSSDTPADWLAKPDSITIEHAGQRQVIALSSGQALNPLGRVAYVLAGILFVLTGAFTWLRSGGGRVQRTFLALCCLIGLVLVVVPASYRGYAWALSLLYGSSIALTALFIFARSFPRIRPLSLGSWRIEPEWFWLAPGLSIIVYSLSLLGLIPYGYVSDATNFWAVVMLVATAVSVGESWWRARRANDQQARVQLAIIGGGALLGFLPSLVTLIARALTNRYLIDPLLAVPFTVLLPIAVAYAMLRYRVMDADLVVRRGIAWLVTAAVFASVIAGASYVIGLIPFFNQPLVPNIAAASLLVAFIPIFNRLIGHLDRAVYGRGHDLRQTLASASRELATTLDEGRLLSLTLERVLETLQPVTIVIFEHCGAGHYQPIAWQRRYEARSALPTPPALAPSHPGIKQLLSGHSWQAQVGDDPHPAMSLLVPTSAPLGEAEHAADVSDEPPWLLGLAPRPSKLPYSSEDIVLLEMLAQGLAAALANARHYGRLQVAYAELHTAQMQLLQAAKLAAIGEVASGITHELNQPLTVLRGRLQRLIANPASESVRPELARMEQQTHKMMQIVAHMRSFARTTHDERQPVALNDIVGEALQLLGQQFRAQGVELVTDLCVDLPPILGDAGQIEQVLINLLSNARDAVSGRPYPSITIVTESAEEMLGWVRLIVADTGAGIASEALAHIFDPFFTTKEEGKGTGLGLSISRGIIERHGGRLEVESTLGVGSAFRILLPSAGVAISAPATSDETAA